MTVSAIHPAAPTTPITSTAAAVHGAWHLFKVMVDAVLNARHHIGQIQSIEALLRQSNACEASDPRRADALRREAALRAG